MKLAAQNRTVFGKKVAVLRSEGWVPAVVYGHGAENMHIAVSSKELTKTIKETGHSGIIMLDIDGKDTRVVAHDWSVDPAFGTYTHVDFKVVKAGEKIEAQVPVTVLGEAPAVKDGIGILNKNLHEVEVEGQPEKIPQEIEVDVTKLTELHAAIHARDLKLPTGVVLLTDPDTVIVAISEIQEDVEPEADMTVADVAVEGDDNAKETSNDA